VHGRSDDKTVLSLITDSWRGRKPLYRVFWLYYILGIFVIGASLGLFVHVAPLLPELITFFLVFAIGFFVLLWKGWALVAIWRCAPNSSRSLYKFFARGYVVFFILIVIAGVVEEIYEEHRQKSLPRAPRVVRTP
jgi:hypothetical protein